MKRDFTPGWRGRACGKTGGCTLPYLLSCAGMVLMFYILIGLSGSTVLGHMSGGDQQHHHPAAGHGGHRRVCADLSVLHPLVPHSPPGAGVRPVQRAGHGQGQHRPHSAVGDGITYGLTTGTGLLLGAVLYKLAELGMVRLLRVPVTYTLTVSVRSLLAAAALFAVIHTLILLNSLRQLHGVSAVALLRSESVGEKPPRAQWVLTAAGVVLLGAAYVLAVSIKEPLAALLWFFAAVIMVILATYLLFISGLGDAVPRLAEEQKILLPAPALRVRVLHGLPHEAQRRGAGVGVHSGHHGAGDDLVHHLPVCGAGGRGECPVSPRHGRGGIRQKRSSAGRGGGGAAASGRGEHRFQLRRADQ